MIDELFDLPIPQKVNKEVVDYLGKQKWSFVNDNDEKYSNSLYVISTNPSIRDAGQAIITYAKDKEHKRDNLLNFFGHLVFSLIQERSKFKIKNINRLYWNFYTPVSEMNFHVDDHNPGRSISAIYNLHTNDGGTVIQDNFIYSKESQAIIFRSEKLHKGIAPKISNCRLSLNLVMSI